MIIQLNLRKFPKETYITIEGEAKEVKKLQVLIESYAKKEDMEVR